MGNCFKMRKPEAVDITIIELGTDDFIEYQIRTKLKINYKNRIEKLLNVLHAIQ